jgi:hypothetical protein
MPISSDARIASVVIPRSRRASPLEGGHGELIEHELVVSWSDFGHKFEPWRTAQEPRLHRVWIIDAPPCHGHLGLERAHPLSWQRQVPAVGHRNARGTA